ncbi:MAG: sigma-70 family RNA polymerase sigma factor [Opitutaceae bacterium]|nr:sigma-70 family RNA polymerase sigma factor [Opitutaceae bacterium]
MIALHTDVSATLHRLPDGTWQSWFEAYGRQLLLFARQWATSAAGAEDIVQEAFVRFWRSPHRNDADAHLQLFAMVRRAGLDQVRATTRRARREHSVATDAESPAWFEPSTDDRDAAIQAALRQLPTEQREVVVLKIWGELTFEQIARTLEIPANTAASRYRYALEALRRTLPSTVS